MNAIRSDEELGNFHSLYVDQWDWERVVTVGDRTVDFLKDIVTRIYAAMLYSAHLSYTIRLLLLSWHYCPLRILPLVGSQHY